MVELKDITDPLPEFYEDDEDGYEKPSSEDGEGEEGEEGEEAVGGAIEDSPSAPKRQPIQPPYRPNKSAPPTTMKSPTPPLPANNTRLPNLHLRTPGLPFPPPPDQISTPFLSRSTTPGGGIPIPGGTSNFTSYFHLPLSNSAGLSGTQTPLLPWGEQYQQRPPSPLLRREQQQGQGHSPFFSTYADNPGAFRPTTGGGVVDSQNLPHHLNHRQEPATTTPKKAPPPPPAPPLPRAEDDRSQDLQTTLHISYSGSLSLSLTAEILLDYPMPSFVGIPLKLQITGLSFDGVALLAYLRHHRRGRAQADGGGGGVEQEEEERRRVHFCFLGREDARAMVGDGHGHGREDDEGGEGRGSVNKSGEEREEEEGLGGLLREIRVESEIGRQENGKQVLKNVGKVEKFVLEQVRRIFEDEFVWPSFWTFLV